MPRNNAEVAHLRLAVFRCVAAALLFGASAPAASRLAGSVPAFVLAGLLYLGAGLGVAPTVLRRRPSMADLAQEWRQVLVAVAVGGAVGPVLLAAGLARTTAASASILLNTELVATVVLAMLVFREHVGARVLAGTALIAAAGATLAWSPGTELDTGAILVVLACICWGLDNTVTTRIQHLAPAHVVLAKGVVAGSANLVIGLAISGPGGAADVGNVVLALVIGVFGYGFSITLWVKGARDLGAARAQVLFSTAPFSGAVIAWTVLGENLTAAQVIAIVGAAAGVALSSGSAHTHDHHHVPLQHNHEHRHDRHHDHQHGPDADPGRAGRVGRVGADQVGAGQASGVRHSHAHFHDALSHGDAHLPDLHHRHEHS